VDTILAAPAREDPREGVKGGPTKTGAGEATGVSEVGPMGRVGSDNIPDTVTKPPREVNGTRRSGDTGVRAHPLPRLCGGSQSPLQRARRKPRGRHREPASTGNRNREFGKQTSDERIDGCFSGGALQGATSREVPSPKEAGTWLGRKILTTRVGREKAKAVRRFPALTNPGFGEEIGLEG
jgi:hypothetical protein